MTRIPGKMGMTSPTRPISIKSKVNPKEETSAQGSTSGLRPDDVDAAHPGAQYLRDDHRSILLLVVFQHGDQRAGQPQTRTVQGMHEAQPAAIRRVILDVRPASLELAHVRHRRDLQPLTAARRP